MMVVMGQEAMIKDSHVTNRVVFIISKFS